MSNFFSKEFLLFLGTGGLAAGINFGSRFFFSRYMDFSNAVIVAYITGMITAFFLAKIFVFKKSRNSTIQSVFYFTLVNGAALLQTWAVSLLLAYKILPAMGIQNDTEPIAHFVGIAVPVFTSYIGHKRLSFRE